ncbi:hypothetical protein F8A90_07690 [Cobetia sp. cqz5-12]|nr:hypothetical protein F8A90_07690 [Cobetia sp. cqz5-12]
MSAASSVCASSYRGRAG